MKTECTEDQGRFQRLGSREVVADFEDRMITSDGGGMLLRQVEQRFQVIGDCAGCYRDHREPARVEHTVRDLLAQRVFWSLPGI